MLASKKAYQRGVSLPSSNPFQRLAELLSGEAPGLDPIVMTIGEPQHAIPDFTAEVLAENMAGFRRYPPIDGSPEFRSAIASWLNRRYNLGGLIDADHGVLPLNGSREGLSFGAIAARDQLNKGLDHPVVILPNPFYQTYAAAAHVADAEAVLSAIGAPAKVQILRGAREWWHPGRHGMICLGPKKVLGVFGEIHPKILREMDVKGPVVGFTIWPAEVPLPRNAGASKGALELKDLQPVDRDFAFVVDTQVEALTLVNAAAGADKAMITDVRVFDEFIGGALGEGKKSIAVTVRIQPQDKTLKDEEIDAISAKVVDKVTKATGGVLRG